MQADGLEHAADRALVAAAARAGQGVGDDPLQGDELALRRLLLPFLLRTRRPLECESASIQLHQTCCLATNVLRNW